MLRTTQIPLLSLLLLVLGSCVHVRDALHPAQARANVQDQDGMLAPGARIVVWVECKAKQPRGVGVDVVNNLYNEVTTRLAAAGYQVVARERRDQVVNEVEVQRLHTADPEASRRIVDGLQTNVGFFFDVDGWTVDRSRRTRRVSFSGSFQVVDFRDFATLGSGTVQHDRHWDGNASVVAVAQEAFEALAEELLARLGEAQRLSG